MTQRTERKPLIRLANDYQHRRRAQALERQSFARKNALNKARHFWEYLLKGDHAADNQDEDSASKDHTGDVQSFTAADGSADTGNNRHQDKKAGPRKYYKAIRAAKPRNMFRDQLMEPEWLIDVPPDLAQNWLVMARPEGERCLVTAGRGWATAHSKRGKLRYKFKSSLPGGSGQTFSEIASVLDCVYSAGDSIFYVLDMLYWKGQPVCDCSAEVRLFLMASRLQEAGFSPDARGMQDFSFVPLACFPCTPEGMRAAYEAEGGFQRDGLLLLHKEGCYEMGALSPLALRWKDAACSRYLVDTDPSGLVQPHQQVILEYRMDRTVGTGDPEPVVLGRLPDAFVSSLGPKLRPGQLMKFILGPGGIQLQDGYPVGADLQFQGFMQSDRRADFWSKIVFQHRARRDPLPFGHLLEATQGTGQPMLSA